MFVYIFLDDDMEISLVLLQEGAVNFGDECFSLWKAVFVYHPSK